MYKKIEIGNLVTLRQGFAINKKTNHHMSEEPTQLHLLRIGDMKDGKFSIFVKDTIPEKFIAKEDDIIYTRTGQVGLVFRKQHGVVHNNCFTVTSNDLNILQQEFLEGTKPNEVNTEFMDNSLITKLVGILTEINIDNGYMRVRVDNEYKYYNFKFEEKTNKEVLTTNTIFLDKKDGKYGFVNKNGIVVVDYIYDDAREQNEYGYASVKKNGMWGCINQKGKVVITPAYQLENNPIIEFIGKWHLGEDLNLNYYTDK